MRRTLMLNFDEAHARQLDELSRHFHFPQIWFEASDFSRKRIQQCAAGALKH